MSNEGTILPVYYGRVSDEDVERFFTRGSLFVTQVGHWRCWVWQGRVCHRGYGRFWLNGQYRQAHRVFYSYINERTHEREISEATPELDHRCNNRACVRPSHMRPVKHKQNHDLRAMRYYENKLRRRPRVLRNLHPLFNTDWLI